MRICPACRGTQPNNVLFCPNDGTPLRLFDSLAPGCVIRKKYELLEQIGHGGMGVVFRARHLIWREERAIKVLNESAGANPLLHKSLLGEAMLMRQLQHPHIVRVE